MRDNTCSNESHVMMCLPVKCNHKIDYFLHKHVNVVNEKLLQCFCIVHMTFLSQTNTSRTRIQQPFLSMTYSMHVLMAAALH